MKEIRSCARELQGRTVGLAEVVREGLPEDMTFELRPAWWESTSHQL